MKEDCPCGSNFPYTDCCGPLIRGAVSADTAEDLMRSRYSAHVVRNREYLLQTTVEEERKRCASKYPGNEEEWLDWKRLEVYESRDGERNDDEGWVQFSAWHDEDGEEQCLRETSKFVKRNGRWYYSLEGSRVHREESPESEVKTVVRDKPKVGRNEPCPCNSGKKYKKCCGK